METKKTNVKVRVENDARFTVGSDMFSVLSRKYHIVRENRVCTVEELAKSGITLQFQGELDHNIAVHLSCGIIGVQQDQKFMFFDENGTPIPFEHVSFEKNNEAVNVLTAYFQKIGNNTTIKNRD